MIARAQGARSRVPDPAPLRNSGRTTVLLAGALSLLTVACGRSGPPEDISAPDLFEWAHQQFEAEEYEDAADGFLAFMIRDPLNPMVDSAQFMVAQSRMRQGDELEAIAEFQRLAIDRPSSPLADDAQLGTCNAYLEAAPRLSLSQEFTRRAIEECERLIQFFPGTPHTAEAERIKAEAQSRLAEQSYEIGKYYQDRQRLAQSAIVYFEKSLSEDPGESYLPDLLLRLYRAYQEVGYDTEAEGVRERLLEEFPDSEQANELAVTSAPQDVGVTK